MSTLTLTPYEAKTALEHMLCTLDERMYVPWLNKQQRRLNELIVRNAQAYEKTHNGRIPVGLAWGEHQYFLNDCNYLCAPPETPEIEQAVEKLMTQYERVMKERDYGLGYIRQVHRLSANSTQMLQLLDPDIVAYVFGDNYFDLGTDSTALDTSVCEDFRQRHTKHVAYLKQQMTRNLLLQ